MNARVDQHYSEQAHKVFADLDARVDRVFEEVKEFRGWKHIHDPVASRAEIIRIISEIFRSVVMYQTHTTEAGFHMFGGSSGSG